MRKICSKCKIEKEDSEFGKCTRNRNGLQDKCKKCNSEYRSSNKDRIQKTNANWYTENIDHCKNYYQEHKETIINRSSLRQKKHKEARNQYSKRYYFKHKNKIRSQIKNRTIIRKTNDPIFKFKKELKKHINSAFKNKGWSKDSTTQELLGCSYEEFYEYLGPKPNGKYDKDHICPLAQARTQDEARKLWHYTNFRWMEHIENVKKSDKWTPEGEEMCRKLLNREWIL